MDAVCDPTAPPIRVRQRNCPVCDASPDGSAKLGYGRPPWTIVACRACGLAYLPTVPETSELVENLAWEKRHGEENARRCRETPIQQWLDRTFRWRLHLLPRTEPVDLLNASGPASGLVVDLGCGSGSALRRIDRRFAASGIEVSRALAAEAQAVAAERGGEVLCLPTHEGLRRFPAASLAGVLARSYLEHDADADAVMQEIGRTLRPDGMAVVKVPNYGSINRRVMGRTWCGFRLPDHVNYFRPRDMARLAGRHGLTASFPVLLSLPTDDNFVAVLRRRV